MYFSKNVSVKYRSLYLNNLIKLLKYVIWKFGWQYSNLSKEIVFIV